MTSEELAATLAMLRKSVDAAREELDEAIVYHEAWRPTAHDASLHARMGSSFASNAFLVVRHALRREMLLALMRLWDNDKRAVNLARVAKAIRERPVIEALARLRTAAKQFPEALDSIVDSLQEKADAALVLLDKYGEGGSHHDVLRRLRILRNEQLAHRQLKRSPVEAFATKGEEVDAFLADMCVLVSLLLGLVLGIAYDPKETGDVYRHHARFFWEAARGERTEGHPSYRPLPAAATEA